MDSLIYKLFYNSGLKMVWVWREPVYLIEVDEAAIWPNYMDWYERKERGIYDQSQLIPLKYTLDLDRKIGFYFELNGRYICPKEYANCITAILSQLFIVAINKTFCVEDIREAVSDLSDMVDNSYATNLLAGNYNPFNILHSQFVIGDSVYNHCIGKKYENRKTA